MDGFLSHIGEMRDTTRLAANLGPASRNRAGRHARQTMHTAGIPHPIPQNHWNSANPTNRRRHRTSGSVGRQRKNTRNPLASHTMSHRTCSIAPHHITPTPIRAPICIIRRFGKMAHTCMCPHLHIKRLTQQWWRMPLCIGMNQSLPSDSPPIARADWQGLNTHNHMSTPCQAWTSQYEQNLFAHVTARIPWR